MKTLQGTIVSNKPAQTVVVVVKRFVKHPKYGKYISRSKRYQAHDEKGHAVGEQVTIKEVKPISRHKHFIVIS